DQAYPRAWGAAVRVETADGERLEAKRADCKGDPENPVGESELAAKAQALMEDGGMDTAAARTLIEKIGGLVEDRPVRSLGLFAEKARRAAVAGRAWAMTEEGPPAEIRAAVRRLCEKFPGEYWRRLDRERAYPAEFVQALTAAGYLATLIPEEYGGAGLALS